MTVDDVLKDGAPPITAILRGITPGEAMAIGTALIDAGLRILEVPFNSPEPLVSIAMLQSAFGDRAVVGGGTVLNIEAVEALAGAGGRIMLTPNTNAAVISRAVALGLDVMPGFTTPSEAFQALDAGAKRLKLFPAATLGTNYIKAIREVLPKGTGVWAVGGTNADTIAEWLNAGCEGIGVGGALFRPGDDAALVADRARALVAAWKLI